MSSSNITPLSSGSSSASATSATPRPSTGPPMSSHPSARHNQAPQRKKGNKASNNNRPQVHISDSLDDMDVKDPRSLNQFTRQLKQSSRRNQVDITREINYAAPIHTAHLNRGSYDSSSWRRTPQHAAYRHQVPDKAIYVNSNYRFVMSLTKRYPDVASNAEARVSWGDVWQVIASSISQASQCPICMSPPTAPRITKCGHIYCLHCALRLVNPPHDPNTEAPPKKNAPKKCPLCDDLVYKTDLRPVRFYAAREKEVPKTGNTVTLTLMSRSSASTLALPHVTSEDGVEIHLDQGKDIPWYFEPNVLDYARVMKGTTEYMDHQYAEEMDALDVMVATDLAEDFGFDDYVMNAVASITEARKKLLRVMDNVPGEPVASAVPGASGGVKAVSTPGEVTIPTDFYFFSAPPHLYLSPLDIRILKEHYGSFAAFPSTLEPKVTALSAGQAMNDDLRRRSRWLNHLPNGCTVTFLECDWSRILPDASLAPFRKELKARQQRHADKDAQEDRERARTERRLDAEMRRNAGVFVECAAEDGYFRPHEIRGEFINDRDEFPDIGNDMSPGPAEVDGGPPGEEEPSEESVTIATCWGTKVTTATSSTDYENMMENMELEQRIVEMQLAQEAIGGGKGKGKGKGKRRNQGISLFSNAGQRQM